MLPAATASSSTASTSTAPIPNDQPVLHPVRLRVLHKIGRGEIDHDLPVLVDLARQMFRLERIQTEAVGMGARTGQSVPFLRASLEHALAEPLDLQPLLITPLRQPALPFKQCDVAACARDIKLDENAHFGEWMAQWPQWQGVLAREPDAAQHFAALVTPTWPEQP